MRKKKRLTMIASKGMCGYGGEGSGGGLRGGSRGVFERTSLMCLFLAGMPC